MNALVILCQLIIALGIFNVWLLRYKKATSWRGGEASNMQEEFEVYGLPTWVLKVVGVLKVALAITLIAGVIFPGLTKPAAIGMAVLMLGAVSMHIKVKDPLKKTLPALTMLLLCLIVAVA